MRRRGALAPVLLLLGALVACRHDPADAPPARAWSPPLATAGGGLLAQRLPRVAYRGGRFLRHPRLVTITFPGDAPDLVARLVQFGDTITRSRWWHAVTDGYCTHTGDCIGEGRPGVHVRLDEAWPAAVRDLDVEALLTREATAGRFGPLDPDTLLLVYLPQGVSLADAFVPQYCAGGPRAFHRALRLAQATVAYAVLPRCDDEAELTAAASHEILEATTNPDPAKRGFAFEPGAGTRGFTAAGVEPVDPCGLLTMDTHWTLESGFVVQRAWSNRAAALGRDPCVPARALRPYVALVPRQPVVRLTRAGDSATVALEAAADRPVPAWAVSAFDLTGYHEHAQYVEVALDKSLVAAGHTATLTIALRKRNAQRLGIVGLVSTLGVYSYMWPVAVVMR